VNTISGGCLIVDDEKYALDIMENYISQINHLYLVGRCSNALEAFDILQNSRVDLLFLDIQMPKLTGLDFLKTLKQPPEIVFTTAYRDYALDGFELDILDYLLKPISFERFLKTISRYESQNTGSQKPVTELAYRDRDDREFVYLKTDKKMVKVYLKEIRFIESLKDYIIVTTTSRKIITYQKISFMQEFLPKDQFLRIHKSFLISLRWLTAYTATCVEIGETELPIGRSFKNGVMAKLKETGVTP
jgi:DNA-binding LytR/AlgR family response regulator